MITIQTDKTHRQNKSVIVAGKEIKFDEFGMAEIPERYVEAILESDPSIIVVDPEDAKEFNTIKEKNKSTKEVASIDIIEENNKLKAENEKLKIENDTLLKKLKEITPKEDEQGGEDDKDEFDLEGLNKKELQELCTKMELPKEEWSKLTVEKLKTYIKDKIK